jgi:hypothetical protein
MDLPLNSGNPDGSSDAARPENSRDIAGAASLATPLATELASPAVAHSIRATDVVGDSTALNELAFVWRRPTRGIGIDPLRLIVIAALTSASVSLLTIWASGRASVPGNEWVPVVTVSYEPLEPAATAQPLEPAGSAAPSAEPANTGAPAFGDAAAGGGTTGSLATARDTTTPQGTSGSAPSGFVVTSQPEGAHVTINGVGYGVTPLNVRFLPPGAKRIRATKAGYQSEERFLSAEAASSTTRLQIVLREIPGGRDPQ